MKQTCLTQAIIILALFITANLAGQVTIGNEVAPNKGALLDLKNQPDGSATKGLALPRVKLTNLKPTTNAALAASIGNTAGSYDLDDHIGLIVYNIEPQVLNPVTCQTTGVPVGLYVWDGEQWQSFQESVVYSITDNRDNETYLARNFGSAGDWMLENMRYAPDNTVAGFTGFTHSATIPSPYTGKYWCYPWKGTSSGTTTYNPTQAKADWSKRAGLLYNWLAASNNQNSSTSDQGQGAYDEGPAIPIQGICPAGWHLPSDREWSQLEKEIYDHADKYSQYTSTDLPFQATYNPPLGVISGWDSRWEGTVYQITNNPPTAIGNVGYRGSTDPTKGHGLAMMSECVLPGYFSGNSDGKSLSAEQGGFDMPLVGIASNGTVLNYNILTLLWSASTYSRAMSNQIVWTRGFEFDSFGGRGVPKVYRSYFLATNGLHSVRCKKD